MVPPSPVRNDELLRPFLNAQSDEEDDATLSALVEIARPIIFNVLRRKVLLLGAGSDLGADLSSLVVMRVIEQLRKCKESYEEGDDAVIIRHFPGLCQMIALNAVNEYLRFKYPRRASVQNQLLYLIREVKDKGGLPLFALWRGVEDQLCGFRSWEGSPLVLTERYNLLSENSTRAMHEALKGEDAGRISLQRLLEALFNWLNTPAVFDAVVGTTARWRGIEDQAHLSLTNSSDEDSPPFEPMAPELSPEEKTVLTEYLRGLWHNITELPLKQRAALLLNLCDAGGRGVLGFLPTLGLASYHEIAEALGMEAREFAALWPALPLEDRAIAQIYDCEVSVVAVWRSRARARLKKMEMKL